MPVSQDCSSRSPPKEGGFATGVRLPPGRGKSPPLGKVPLRVTSQMSLEEEMPVNCSQCATRSCSALDGRYPADCPTANPTPAQTQALREARAAYDDPAVRELAHAAAWTEKAGYCKWTRLEETVELARRMGWRRLGIACCSGLRREAAVVSRYFGKCGFDVRVVICKAGAVPKTSIGVPDADLFAPGETMCNSVGQAALLAAEEVEFSVVMGLCVGHDTLFLGESFRRGVPATVLVAKDRVTGHCPAAAIYGADGYFAARLASHHTAPPTES
jgi:uncharacterized metal-binding protein